MAFRPQPLKLSSSDADLADDLPLPWGDGSMLGVRKLNDSGLVLHTRRWFDLGSELALSLQLPEDETPLAGREDRPVFIHVHAAVAGRRVVKDSPIGRIYEVTLVFNPKSSEQRRRLSQIASGFSRAGIAVPTERNSHTGEPNPLFGLN